MKAFVCFLLGIGFCGVVVYLFELSPTSLSASAADVSFHEKNRHAVDSIEEKLKEWRLGPDDIKSDLAKTGEVVRQNAQSAGEKINNARIVAVIKAKFVLHHELYAHEIDVDCHDGNVALRGYVGSHDLIGKAVALALDTDGVRHVVSNLGVQPTTSPELSR